MSVHEHENQPPYDPHEIPLTDQAIEAISQTRHAAMHTHEAVERLLEYVERVDEPARLDTVILTGTRPIFRDDSREVSRSVGLINPTDLTIFIGFAGGSATPQGRAVPVPPNSAMVIPVSAEDLEIGADQAALTAGGDAVLFLLRFAAVQMFHLWRF